MPPKQKQVKKGPVYKASLPLKDLIPSQIKQLPRQPKTLKTPESFPQAPKNNEAVPPLFDQWPSQQVVKSHDFGINTQVAFNDSYNDNIEKFFTEKVSEWKRMNQIQNDGNFQEQSLHSQQQQIKEKSKNQIQSLKNIQSNNVEVQKRGDICVIETYMRPETQSQMQTRLKQQAEKAEKAAKDKKKAPKKQQPKEQGPIQVSDVQMSNVIVRTYMNDYSIWIGSQLQLIKQRNLVDINNNEAIWKKIYPQQNGVPKITKSGKYWVKLLYMGKYIKIQVDDRIPVNEFHQQLFPLSEKLNQKWTLILTKALIKYLSKALNDKVIGSSLIIYALTGMISQNIALNRYKQWEKLEQFLSDSHYQKKDIIVSCFSSNKNKNFKKLTKFRVQKQGVAEQIYEDQFIEKQIHTRILNGYSYCIGDYVDNKNLFNMVFSLQKSQKEMLLKNQFNELCKVSISNKSREEKLQYRKKKKELKQKLGIQQKKRLELIAKDPIRYHFLKLLSSTLKIQCQYRQKEINLAKKCILNKLSQPPNYDIPIQKEEKDAKSMQSLSGVKFKDEAQLFPNIHDFSLLANVLEVFERKDQGTWIKDEDLLQFFQYMQVIYNPNCFSNKKIELIQCKKNNAFTNDENKQILVIQKVEQEQQKQNKVRVMFGFAYQKSAYDIFNPYTMLQKFDFDSFRSTSNVATLNTDVSSKLLQLKNQNTVFKLNTMSKGNYNYWISSDSPFKLLSISDYLSQYQGYLKKNITFEYPAIQANTFFPINKIKLKHQGSSQSNTIILKVNNIKQELLNNINYRLVQIPKEENSLTSEEIQGIIIKNKEKILLSYQYTRFSLQAGCQYYLVVEAHSKDNVPDGSMEIQLLSKEDGLVIEQLEQVQPIKFIQKYNPNKYALICKERIFTNSDNNATFTFKIAQFQQIQGGGGGKGAKKGGKEEPTSQLIQKPYNDSKNIIVKILNGQNILYQATGINSVTIPNFKFLSTKANPSKQYYLCCHFNLREWPEASIKNQYTQKICWVTQIISQESLAFVRDTKQEEKQRLTKKSWEDGEPGRAERAKKARRRFLIQIKKQKGEQLTQEQQLILNAPRLTKKQQLQQEKKNEEKKGGKGAKKDDKKGKEVKKEQVIQQKPIERPPPKSKENFTNQIREYLEILQNCTVQYIPSDGQPPKIRSEEQLKSIKQGAIMSIENRVSKLIRNIQKRQTIKIRQKQKKQSLSIYFSELRAQFKQKYSSYIQWRNQDSEKDKVKQDKEKLLIEIINQEKPTISQNQLKKHINEYRDINGHNSYLADVADMVRKNIRINSLTDKILNLIPLWEVEELKNINQEIKNDKIEGIDEQVLKQLKDILDQVERNPNIVAQKQAEAKKGKKGGKK